MIFCDFLRNTTKRIYFQLNVYNAFEIYPNQVSAGEGHLKLFYSSIQHQISKNMVNQTDNWTYAEFHAFVMLYAANTDGNLAREEEELIVPTLTAAEYTRIKSIFMACDDADALDIIFSYRKQYCRTKADKDKILADMLEIYQADAGIGQIERSVHHIFERML